MILLGKKKQAALAIEINLSTLVYKIQILIHFKSEVVSLKSMEVLASKDS